MSSFLKDKYRAHAGLQLHHSHPRQQKLSPKGQEQLNVARYSKKSSDQNALTYFIDLPGLATPPPFP